MDAPDPTTRDVLTQEEARQRAEQVSRPEYALHLDLQDRTERYRGELTLTFEMAQAGSTFLDCTAARLDTVEVNAAVMDAPDWNAYRLTPHEIGRASRRERGSQYV